MALVQKAFSDIITFSRSSNATRVGPTGLVEYAPHNLFTRSQEFDNAAWSKTAITVTANAVAAPDGTVTAESLIPDTTSADHRVEQTVGGSDSPYTLSVYAKSAGYYLALVINGSGRIFDLTNGTSTAAVSSGATSFSIVSVGNGWYRCSITRTLGAGSNYPAVIVTASSSTVTSTGNGTSGIYLWGAQLAVGPYALDYTPTTSAAVYGPRFDYDPVTLAARGLLVEESRSNLLTYSEQFDNAAWTKASVTVSSNSAVSPDGTTNADTLIPTTNTADHDLYPLIALTATSHTLSIYAKYSGYNLALSVALGGSIWAGCIFDLQNGVAKTPQGSNLTCTANIQNVGNGWYRCSITYTATAASWYQIISATNDVNATMGSYGFISFTGNGTSGIYIWGAQLEAGSFATSYIPTIASTVTRSADVASVNTLSPWFNATEGTLFFEGSSQGTSGSRMTGFSDGSTSNRILLYFTNQTSPRGIVTVAGVTQANDGVTIADSNVVNKMATGYATNNFIMSSNGMLSPQDTSILIPTVTTLHLGCNETGASNFLNGRIRRVAYYPRRLTDAEIQALTS